MTILLLLLVFASLLGACNGPPRVASSRGPGLCAGPLDVAIVLDVTSSMSGALEAIRAEIPTILDQAEQASEGDLRVALVTFADEVKIRQPFQPGNREAIDREVRGLSAAGGGSNEPEASAVALGRAIRELDFRLDRTGIAVIVTDARPGLDDRHIAGRDDVYAHAQAEEARARSIKVASVFVPTPHFPEFHSTARQILQDYARTSGGMSLEARPDGRGTGRAIRDAVRACGVGSVGGNTMNEIDFGSPLKLLGALFLLAFVASVPERNSGMHVLNGILAALAFPFVLLCNGFGWLAGGAERRSREWLSQWIHWAKPNDEDPYEAVAPGAWQGWDLVHPLWRALKLMVMAGAEIVLLGLGATRALGYDYAYEPEPVLFGLTVEALAFAAAIILSGIAFLDVVFDLRAANPGAARPWGNASPNTRRWVSRGCFLGLAVWMLGILTFALQRSAIMLGVGNDGILGTMTPYVFVPAFAFAIAGAIAVLFWSLVVGSGAVAISATTVFGLVPGASGRVPWGPHLPGPVVGGAGGAALGCPLPPVQSGMEHVRLEAEAFRA